MEMNFISPFVAALVTLVVGFVWYHPKVFGTIWMKENGFNQEELQKGNMLKIMGLCFVFSFFIAMVLQYLTILQMGAFGMIGGLNNLAEAKPSFAAFMSDYGTAFRTARHGALHGTITGLLFAFPMIGINGLFERKSWKYIFIHAGYWTVSFMIMGAILCAWV